MLAGIVVTFGMFTFGVFVVFFATKDHVSRLVIVATMALLLLGLQVFIFRVPAQITALCCSTAMNDRSIVKAAARHFGSADMSEQVRLEHANFMDYLQWIECGFEVPLLGAISMSRLLNYAKLIVTAIPIAIGYILNAS
mmetsp:Transcript_61984/g.200859  ORF Transcript_61984/g.200859 Transcript_61984/m.200859 type:complete len:139 (+) Transcript_61984:213-629(+)